MQLDRTHAVLKPVAGVGSNSILECENPVPKPATPYRTNGNQVSAHASQALLPGDKSSVQPGCVVGVTVSIPLTTQVQPAANELPDCAAAAAAAATTKIRTHGEGSRLSVSV
jgi:hypothetical protein